MVEACAVGLYGGLRLLAFVVVSACDDQRPASPLTSTRKHVEQPITGEHQEDLSSSVNRMSGTDRDLSKLLRSQLSLRLPSYSVPDTLLVVLDLCVTPHGKTDMEALMKIYESQRRCLLSGSSPGDVTKLKEMLQSLWQETLGLPEDVIVDPDSSFFLSGGDSLKALHLCEDIVTAVGSTSPELLEVIFNGTFSDILHHVAGAGLMLPLKNSPSSLPEVKKRHANASPPVAAKRRSTAAAAAEEEERAFKVISRAGQISQVKMKNLETISNFRTKALGGESSCDTGGGDLSLKQSWSSDTGRCVDASPVLLVQEPTDQRSHDSKATVFIGSHSHRIQALDLTTGSLLWERVLGDRIEASAAVSHCGRLVIVGCYDGWVYFLCAASGKTRWTFETGDAVKSCPAVDPLTGLVMVGSHDGHVYALDPQVEQCVWRRHCGGGAVFSSPYLQSSLRQLYVASLGGHLLCLDADSGDILWSYSRDVPFFSSPNVTSAHVLIGSVDGNICCFTNAGKLVWQFLTKGAIFSSPCITSDQRRVLCGSHDGCLYCVNCADGSLVWTFQTTGKVYSSPCVFDGAAAGRSGMLVAVASTDGTLWILDGHDGQMLSSFTLPGELFSSPVVWGRSLVVGCRNDSVYCLKLTVDEDNISSCNSCQSGALGNKT